MRIGKLASLTHVSRDTIRFYEQKGLLKNITRPSQWNNYKDYGEENVKRIEIVIYLKKFSFTLTECKEILDLRDENPNDCLNRAELLSKKLEVIESKISELNETRDKLITIITKYKQ